MTTTSAVLRDDDPRRSELQAQGWQVVAQSWGAQLDAAGADRNRLQTLVDLARPVGEVRELTRADVAAILALDLATIRDYPGGVASAHPALTSDSAQVGPERRAFGVVSPEGDLVAMTFVDLDCDIAETDFTVVAPMGRGCCLSTAVKAASVLALLAEGTRAFRTGGSAENPAILAANHRVGYVVDERWLTFASPAPQDAAQSSS
ncbi:hypothetical protein SAMN05216410_2698 [Sanguibacter gelidistatuariae]|uniref:N-acetyltransferase domain-containing protein n=1 Tax=Sanguibacter gelidistatuariae TaxID=1814289 RepID=A0A1G6RIV3_9MICO|nr:acetyltransferase [Sanguibacter gelidistatuariae]SDD04371.1 hypothetical protein SAMN05216410_2698 [Sanguibacter gelidistatuariae]